MEDGREIRMGWVVGEIKGRSCGKRSVCGGWMRISTSAPPHPVLMYPF
jgi:hypothetical protein